MSHPVAPKTTSKQPWWAVEPEASAFVVLSLDVEWRPQAQGDGGCWAPSCWYAGWLLETWKMLAYVDVEVAFCRVIAIDEQLYFVSQRQMQFCSWQEKNEAGQSKMPSSTNLCAFEAQKNHEKSQPHVLRTETFLRSKGVTTWLYVSGLDKWKTPFHFIREGPWKDSDTHHY